MHTTRQPPPEPEIETTNTEKVALVTGASRRLGRAISEHLHASGYRLILHYGHSEQEAQALATDLNKRRPTSAIALQADLSKTEQRDQLAGEAQAIWNRVDVLVNNASTFLADTPKTSKAIAHADQNFQANFSVNTEAPYALSIRLADCLSKHQGQIINLVDIYAERPLKAHTSYSMSKAANAMLVKSLAIELAPKVRVNGIAPGAILWPEQDQGAAFKAYQDALLAKIPLRRLGSLNDITRALAFILECDYLNGQILNIDGGRSLTI